MDKLSRRAPLRSSTNPEDRLDYVAAMSGHMDGSGNGGRLRVEIRYIPDKHILDPEAFGDYLQGLGAIEWQRLEAAAAAILEDLNNEIVPRWVQVTVAAPESVHAGIDSHQVMLEDRQPRWDNPALLSRLRKF